MQCSAVQCMILLLLLSWDPMVSVAARYSYHGGVITLSSVKAEWNLKAQSYLAFHLTSCRQTDPETHVGGPRRREILGFKLFSLDISHKPWQTILRRYLNWIAPWEEKIVSWQYNSSKVSPQTNWKVLQDSEEPKTPDIGHSKHICWSWRENSSSFWPV